MQLASKSADGSFVNNEFVDVYLVTTKGPIPLEAFVLQEEEVQAVRCQLIIGYKQPLLLHVGAHATAHK